MAPSDRCGSDNGVARQSQKDQEAAEEQRRVVSVEDRPRHEQHVNRDQPGGTGSSGAASAVAVLFRLSISGTAGRARAPQAPR